MFRFLLLFTFLFSLSNASTTVLGVYFDDYEENATLYLVNYYPRQHFVDLGLTSTMAYNVVTFRPYTTIAQFSSSNNTLTASHLLLLRADSHLIDWNKYTDQFGMTLHETNFLYGLTGVLVGFGFMIGFITIFARRS